MNSLLTDFSAQLATAVHRAAASIVQVHGAHRPAAGVVIAEDLILAPARAVGEGTVAVRLPAGNTLEGGVHGHAYAMGLGVVRVPGLGLTPLPAVDEPKVGHLALAVGRTWSGGVMATLTNVAVVGGPLRTSRASQLDRVIRIAQAPHGALTGGALVDAEGRALGLITASAIRGTTVVIPALLAWAAAETLAQGGSRTGFLGLGSMTVVLPERQRDGRPQEYGLLVTAVVPRSPADTAGLLVGDLIVGFEGQIVEEPDALVMLLRGDRIGKPATLTLIRGAQTQEVTVTVGERPRRERSQQG